MFFFAKLMHGVVKINKILLKTQNKCIVKVCLDFHFFYTYHHFLLFLPCFVFYSLPPVFALHFVEGLPNNDVSTYTFNFKGRNYSVTTVIQYKSHLKHFVTWTCSADGMYLCVKCEQTTELFNVVQMRENRMLKLRNIYLFKNMPISNESEAFQKR